MTDNKLDKYRLTLEGEVAEMLSNMANRDDEFGYAYDWLGYAHEILSKLLPLLEEVKREGREEVVEWMKGCILQSLSDTDDKIYCRDYRVYDIEWQAKLKEWGDLQQGKEGE